MQRLSSVIALSSSLFFAVGCSQTVQPVTAGTVSRRVFKRNYEIGQSRSAFVGEQVVSAQDYHELHRTGQTMRPNKDFRVKLLGAFLICGRDSSSPVVGTFSRDGVSYRVVLIWTDSGQKIAVLVDPTGRPYRKLLGAATTRPVLMLGEALFEPPDIVFEAGPEDVTIDSTAGFVNFELLYGGTDGRSFTLTYREYTSQDLLKAGFSQTLTYPVSSSVVRFRNLQLQVQEVTGERITYTVVADGLARN